MADLGDGDVTTAPAMEMTPVVTPETEPVAAPASAPTAEEEKGGEEPVAEAKSTATAAAATTTAAATPAAEKPVEPATFTVEHTAIRSTKGLAGKQSSEALLLPNVPETPTAGAQKAVPAASESKTLGAPKESHASRSARLNAKKATPELKLAGDQNSMFDLNTSSGRTKKKVFDILEGGPMNVVIVILTLIALFWDDIRLAATTPEVDEGFEAVTIVVLVFFFVELIIRSWVQPGYFGSFFFVLDFVAMISLIPDIPIIWDPLILGLAGGSDVGGGDLTVARAARASRAGTKAGRFVRLIRLMRLARIAKLFEGCARQRDKQRNEEEEKLEEVEAESKVGATLSEQTTRKVVMMVLAMLIIIQVLKNNVVNHAESHLINNLQTICNRNVSDQFFFSHLEYVFDYYSDDGREILLLEIVGTNRNYSYDGCIYREGVEVCGADVPDADKPVLYSDTLFRTNEFKVIERDEEEMGTSATAYFSVKATTVESANLAIVLTVFVIILLTAGAGLINTNTRKIVIEPIERMLSSIRALHKEPLQRLEAANKDDTGNETNLLERTLMKLTRLLQVGLGEAGSRMIRKCLEGEKGDLNPLVDGTRVIAIFGFCDIRQFTFATECLKEEVMMYVNTVASIVHTEVAAHKGFPNKNIGDAFLVVWRLRDAILQQDLDVFTNDLDQKVDSPIGEEMNDLADNALASFLRSIIQIKVAKSLVKYKSHPALLKHFDVWEVKLGYGLHIGWAIEGPIGSVYKIDSSYLSHHVNLSEQLESMTKNYGVPLLMSGEFQALLSPYAKARTRRLDRIMVEGRDIPLDIYTFDLMDPDVQEETEETLAEKASYEEKDAEAAPVVAVAPAADAEETKADEAFQEVLVNTEGTTSVAYDNLYAGIAPAFYRHFKIGVDNYVDGDWKVAVQALNKAREILPADRPTIVLLEVMESGKAPDDWPGYRVHHG